MPSPKARYTGGHEISDEYPWDFTELVKENLREIYFTYHPDQSGPSDEERIMTEAFNKTTGKTSTPYSAADRFVAAALTEGRSFLGVENEVAAMCPKADLLAEGNSILRRLRRNVSNHKLANNLRHLSPELDIHLGVNADPLGLADSIVQGTATKRQFKDLADHFVKALKIIEAADRKPTRASVLHYYARELAIRLCREMRTYDMPVFASGTGGISCPEPDEIRGPATVNYVSHAVKVVQIIFKSLGFSSSLLTIRDLVGEVKRDGMHLPPSSPQ